VSVHSRGSAAWGVSQIVIIVPMCTEIVREFGLTTVGSDYDDLDGGEEVGCELVVRGASP